jgi:hypothetical protein
MASLQQLQTDVSDYMNRRDMTARFPGWVSMVETELNETLRSRPQVTSAIQAIDNPYIALPYDFATMESIRDATTGVLLNLKDEWSGSWTDTWGDNGTNGGNIAWSIYGQVQPNPAASAYRIVANCIEFLPHPSIPDPPDPNWVPQQVLMGYYSKMRPLIAPGDTNVILESYYACYLFGVLRYAAGWAKDADRAAQADAAYQQAVTRANTHKQSSDYSGAPLREEAAAVF